MDHARDADALLMPDPRSLHQLWNEHIHGNGDNKPAKCFARAERGQCKLKCSRRKVLWGLVSGMVRAGGTDGQAIDKICAVCGPNRSVTDVINGTRRDKRNSTLHHSLCV